MSKGKGDGKGSLIQGTLDFLVLRILEAGPKHGFAISRRLTELSNEWLQVDEGSLYPCLYRMEQRGWIRSEVSLSDNKRRARYYTLTSQGEEELQQRAENWHHFSGIVATVLRKG